MEMKITFKVTARCREMKDNIDSESYNDENIELELTKRDALFILFKFTEPIFKLDNGVTMMIKMNPNLKLKAMILIIDDKKYIVLNPNQIWSETLKAYEDISLFERIQVLSSINVPDIEEE